MTDEAHYSRQLYVLGAEAQQKLGDSRVLLINLRGVGLEIAKNIVLAGVHTLYIHDDTTIDPEALSTGFFYEKGLGKRLDYYVKPFLKELNPFVNVIVLQDEFNERERSIINSSDLELSTEIRENEFLLSKQDSGNQVQRQNTMSNIQPINSKETAFDSFDQSRFDSDAHSESFILNKDEDSPKKMKKSGEGCKNLAERLDSAIRQSDLSYKNHANKFHLKEPPMATRGLTISDELRSYIDSSALTCVIGCNLSNRESVSVSRTTKYISCNTDGLFSRVFVDFKRDFLVSDPSGEPLISGTFTEIVNGTMFLVDGDRHGLESGDLVQVFVDDDVYDSPRDGLASTPKDNDGTTNDQRITASQTVAGVQTTVQNPDPLFHANESAQTYEIKATSPFVAEIVGYDRNVGSGTFEQVKKHMYMDFEPFEVFLPPKMLPPDAHSPGKNNLTGGCLQDGIIAVSHSVPGSQEDSKKIIKGKQPEILYINDFSVENQLHDFYSVLDHLRALKSKFNCIKQSFLHQITFLGKQTKELNDPNHSEITPSDSHQVIDTLMSKMRVKYDETAKEWDLYSGIEDGLNTIFMLEVCELHKLFMECAKSFLFETKESAFLLFVIFYKNLGLEIMPVCSVVGGFAAQEVIKACTNKFTPLRQFMYYNSHESCSGLSLSTHKLKGTLMDILSSVLNLDSNSSHPRSEPEILNKCKKDADASENPEIAVVSGKKTNPFILLQDSDCTPQDVAFYFKNHIASQSYESCWESGYLETIINNQLLFTSMHNRYSSFIQIFGLQSFMNLAHSKILILGAGAIGCEHLKNTVMLGIGHLDKLIVVDMDSIELSNLNRQFLFRKDDIGKMKAEIAAKKCVFMNSDYIDELQASLVELDPLEPANSSNSLSNDNGQVYSNSLSNDNGLIYSKNLSNDFNNVESLSNDLNPSKSLSNDLNPSKSLSNDLNPSKSLSNDLNPSKSLSNDLNPSKSLSNDFNTSKGLSNDSNSTYPQLSTQKNHTQADFSSIAHKNTQNAITSVSSSTSVRIRKLLAKIVSDTFFIRKNSKYFLRSSKHHETKQSTSSLNFTTTIESDLSKHEPSLSNEEDILRKKLEKYEKDYVEELKAKEVLREERIRKNIAFSEEDTEYVYESSFSDEEDILSVQSKRKLIEKRKGKPPIHIRLREMGSFGLETPVSGFVGSDSENNRNPISISDKLNEKGVNPTFDELRISESQNQNGDSPTSKNTGNRSSSFRVSTEHSKYDSKSNQDALSSTEMDTMALESDVLLCNSREIPQTRSTSLQDSYPRFLTNNPNSNTSQKLSLTTRVDKSNLNFQDLNPRFLTNNLNSNTSQKLSLTTRVDKSNLNFQDSSPRFLTNNLNSNTSQKLSLTTRVDKSNLNFQDLNPHFLTNNLNSNTSQKLSLTTRVDKSNLNFQDSYPHFLTNNPNSNTSQKLSLTTRVDKSNLNFQDSSPRTLTNNLDFNTSKILFLTTRVDKSTEEIYSNNFFSSIDIIANALDNVETRRYIDGRCTVLHKPLFESGTLGTKGNTQVVIPNLFENYSASSDPPEKEIPLCTLRNFPYNINHCVEFAVSEFKRIFEDEIQQLIEIKNKLMKNSALFSEKHDQQALNNQKLIENLESCGVDAEKETIKLLRFIPSNKEECLASAFYLFYTLFNTKMQQWLITFPLDHVTSEGTLFWSPPKKAPHPIDYEDSANNLSFILSFCRLYAMCFEYNCVFTATDVNSFFERYKQDISEFIDYKVRCMAAETKNDTNNHENSSSNVKIRQEVSIKAQQTSQDAGGNTEIRSTKEQHNFEVKRRNEAKHENATPCATADHKKLLKNAFYQLDREDISRPDIQKILSLKKITPIAFEKDDRLHVDFLHAFSNLRAKNYRIKQTSAQNAKQIAGKIIPAIATTTAMVSGLTYMEIVKYIIKTTNFKNHFISLGLPYIGASDPMAPEKSKYWFCNQEKSCPEDCIILLQQNKDARNPDNYSEILAFDNSCVYDDQFPHECQVLCRNGFKREYTIWTQINIMDVSVQDIQNYFKNKYQVDVDMVICNDVIVYASYYNVEEFKKNITRRITELVPKDTLYIIDISIDSETEQQLPYFVIRA